MATSSEDLRRQFLAQILNQGSPQSGAAGISSIANSLAAAIAGRSEVGRAQTQEREEKAKAKADKIGEEVGLRDALVGLGIDPGQAGSIASLPQGSRASVLGRIPTAAETAKATADAEQTAFERENTLFGQEIDRERLAETRAGRKQRAEQGRLNRAQSAAGQPLEKVFDPATGITTFAPRSEAVGRQAPPKSGLEITTDAEGQTTVRTNVQGSGSAFGKTATGTIEKKLVELSAARERLGNIASEFSPDFLTLQTRAGMSFKEMRDKVGLLPPDQQAQLADFTRFRQNTIKNFSRTIKDITGATMNQTEAPRIEGEVPVATDSPAVFEAKLRNAMRLAGLAQARLVHLRNQGVPVDSSFGGIGLDDMPSIMDARGESLEQELITQGFAPEVAEQQALAQVRQEFGF